MDKYKKKRRGFHGYKPEKVTTTTTQSESMPMHREEPDLSLSAVGKTEKEFVVEDVENLKTINKIVSIAVNSNSSQGPSISDVVSCKMKRERVFQKSTMIILQAQRYKIIDSNILQSMLNEVGRCTSCGEQKLQISGNVNKRIGMCEHLVLFASVVRRIFILFLQVLK